jgi:hypothetical protein
MALRRLTVGLQVYLVGGSIPEREGTKIYNTCIIVGPGRHDSYGSPTLRSPHVRVPCWVQALHANFDDPVRCRWLDFGEASKGASLRYQRAGTYHLPGIRYSQRR